MAKVRVYYTGLSDVRKISADDLKPHGIGLSEDLIWDKFGKANGGVLDIPRLAITIDAPDELIDLLRRERTFTIKEVNDDGSDGDDIITGRHIDEGAVTASTLVDGDTGQTVSASAVDVEEQENAEGNDVSGDLLHSVTKYDDMLVDDLKSELSKRDLPVSGTKQELISRLSENDQQA